jgi:non-specific serine/threonine protein kinase
LRAEARAAAKLNHPNIVSVFDAGEMNSNPFIVMELVEGKTLREYAIPNLAEALNIAIPICKALEHAHIKGIIHRDLKLENIIVTDAQVIKLMDFGLALTIDQTHLLEDETIVGTFAYLAPELIQGEAASAQSDLYALGVVLYELLTGISPFNGTISEILSRHLHGKVQLPSEHNPNIPEWLDSLVLQLLAKRPEERPASVRVVLDILDQKVAPAITNSYKVAFKPRNNLPAQSTSFIGREKEIAEIKKQLESHRLVTLTGSGGTGKTRLSLQVATDLLDYFDHGVWLVELAPLTDPDLVPQTILSTMGVSEQPGKLPIESLKEYLHEKKLLIVLDNCEHLIEASAKVTDMLLNTAPELKILASSREALAVKGELSYPVPSLSLPDIKHLLGIEQISQYEAVWLFLDRASLVTPHFGMDKDNAPFIAQICSQLDGIPLAIELAAARVKVLSVEQIAKRLDDRFRLLTGGARTALPRQQTLRATIDWSYNLLSEQEKTLFRRLAVFVGGWTLEAAEEVCGGDGIESDQILDLMSQLINKSLVAVETTRTESRYRILETVRQYARAKLFDTEEASLVRDRHLDYFMRLAEQAVPELHQSNQIFWFNKMEDELDNIRAALDWGLQEVTVFQNALRVAAAVGVYWVAHSYFREGIEQLSVYLSRATEKEHEPLRVKLLYYTGAMAGYMFDYATGRNLCQQAVGLARGLGSKRDLANALFYLSEISAYLGQSQEAHAEIEECIALCRQENYTSQLSVSLTHLGMFLTKEGHFQDAQSILEEALAIASHTNDLWGIGHALLSLGSINRFARNYEVSIDYFVRSLAVTVKTGDHRADGITYSNLALLYFIKQDYERSGDCAKKSFEIFQTMGNEYQTPYPLRMMGYSAIHAGNLVRARVLMRESLIGNYAVADMVGQLACLVGFAYCDLAEEDYKNAVRLCALAETQCEQQGASFLEPDEISSEEICKQCKKKLGKAVYEAAYQEGGALKLESILMKLMEK